MKASTVSGGAVQERVRPAPAAKANAAAEWPEAKEWDSGILTWRDSGTAAATRSGRLRLASGFTTPLMTAEVTAIEATPLTAAFLPAVPPNRASPAAIENEIRERSAAWDRRRRAASREGVGDEATAV